MPPQSNPGARAAIGTGIAMVAVPAIFAGPILGVLGFGAAGVAAGSAAAGIQSGIGSVAAGSLFATLQSAGAGGYGVAAVHGVIQAVEAVVSAGGIGAWFHGQDDNEGDSGNDGDSSNDGTSSEKEMSGKNNSTNNGDSKALK